jgi:hypothetical protein
MPFFPLTVPNPAGFTAAFAVRVTNEDVGRGKTLLVFASVSATSLLIASNTTKTFTVAAGLSFPGQVRVRAFSLANPANWMSGTVNSYVALR